METAQHYPRDMRGYGQHPPHAAWPGGAKIAVQFVLNYEEGGENCVLHGDEFSESFLSEIVNAAPYKNARHLNMESLYEYGSRAGFWRLHRIFCARDIPVTVFAVAMALDRNREAAAAMGAAGWEIASHGYRWLDYQFVDEKTERAHLQKAIAIHSQITGAPPGGFYCGRTSPNTRRLAAAVGDFVYLADSYADELPYWLREYEKPQLVVPYTLDANDMRFACAPGFGCGAQFLDYLKDSFDVLYAEGDSSPKMMSIGLHCRLIGRPGRAAALIKFIDYLKSFERVWIARRIDIARHWRRNFPPDANN